MAATDKTYRNQKTLNLIFAVSCVAFLLSCIWMMADDYSKPFKKVQREFRDVESNLNLALALEQVPTREEVEKAREALVRARQELEATRASLEGDRRKLLADRDKADLRYQLTKADYDALASQRDIAAEHVGNARTTEDRAAAEKHLREIQQRLDTLKARLDSEGKTLDEALAALKYQVTDKVREYEDKVSLAEDEMKKHTALFDRFAKVATEKRWKMGDSFRNLPIIDGFNPPVRIHQFTLDELPIDYGGFKYVTRYDRCMTCHLGIDRSAFDRSNLTELADRDRRGELQKYLNDAHAILKDRVKSGETVGFDPEDLPEKLNLIKLTPGEIGQYAAHPRLDLFVDSNSPHPSEKFGCTICHDGQGSATSFVESSHTPSSMPQRERWEKSDPIKDGYHWHAMHHWDFPMLPKRFNEASCLKCHHQVHDLVRFGSKEEAPKLLEGYELVRENGCFGCHEISGMMKGRPVGPDLRLEPTPPLDWLAPAEQVRAKVDTFNPPGTQRKVGPSLRRLDEKAEKKWLLSWLKSPRGFRPDTKMPHFYDLSTNNEAVLPDDQKPFPAAEMHSIAHYLLTESGQYLDGTEGEDSTRAAIRKEVQRLQTRMASDLVNETSTLLVNAKERKDLSGLSMRYRDLCLMSNPRNKDRINGLSAVVQDVQDQVWDTAQQREIAAIRQRLADVAKESDEIGKSIEEWKALAAGTLKDVQSRLETERNAIQGLLRNMDRRAVKAPPARVTQKVRAFLGDQLQKIDADLKDIQDSGALAGDKATEKAKELIGKQAARLEAKKADLLAEKDRLPEDEKAYRTEATALATRLTEDMKALIEAAKPLRRLIGNDAQLIDANGKPFAAKDVPAADKKNDPTFGHGRRLFTEKGCLACHSHVGTMSPIEYEQTVKVGEKEEKSNFKLVDLNGSAQFAPELSRILAKLREVKDRDGNEVGRRLWLIQWILNPTVHHPRTKMPVTQLSVEEAASIADWLLSQSDGWRPEDVPEPDLETLKVMAKSNLVKVPAVGRLQADKVLDEGLTEDQLRLLAADADEQLLVGKKGPIDVDRLKRYIGKKAIGRQGCYGCHDIPGFENLKPIGTPLNDWGKKDAERLAFEDANAFVQDHYAIAHSRDDAKNPAKPSDDWLAKERPLYEEFFSTALKEHKREGFLHLKLAEPRSYDYQRNRAWEDRLRMPQFKFAKTARRENNGSLESAEEYKLRRDREGGGRKGDDRESKKPEYDGLSQFHEAKAREAVMTFVLGLIAEPIPLKFVSQPKGAKAAEVRGRQVLEKFNCAGCHEVRPGSYQFKLPEVPPNIADAERKRIQDERTALLTELIGPPAEEDDSLKKDHPFHESSVWTGRPSPIPGQLVAHGVSTVGRGVFTDEQTGNPAYFNGGAYYSSTKSYRVRLTEALRIEDGGKVHHRPAGSIIALPEKHVLAHSQTYGGDFARLAELHLANVNKTVYGDPGVNSKQRAALPPPLIREGERVQPAWLYKFLLDPVKVRPWTVLRMPRFNMTEEEAQILVEYFAAVDRVNNPGLGLTEDFVTAPQQDPGYWRGVNKEYLDRLTKVAPKHLEERREELKVVWERMLEEQVAQKKRDLAGADYALKTIKEKPGAKPEEIKADEDARKAVEAELKQLEDQLKAKDFKSKEYEAFGKQWEAEQVFASDGHRIITDSKSICMTCHSVGDRIIAGEQGPNLGIASERLRPQWVGMYIASPSRFLTYQNMMPQNYPKGDPLPPYFVGDPKDPGRDYSLTARDVLMDLHRIANLPVVKFRLAPKGGR